MRKHSLPCILSALLIVAAFTAPFVLGRLIDFAVPRPPARSPMHVELEELRSDKMDEISWGDRPERVIEAEYARKAHAVYRRYGYDVPELPD